MSKRIGILLALLIGGYGAWSKFNQGVAGTSNLLQAEQENPGGMVQGKLSWPPQLNQSYPDLKLIDQTGQEVRLSSFKGKVIFKEFDRNKGLGPLRIIFLSMLKEFLWQIHESCMFIYSFTVWI